MGHVDTFCQMRDLLLEIYTASYGMFFSVAGESKYLIVQLVFQVLGQQALERLEEKLSIYMVKNPKDSLVFLGKRSFLVMDLTHVFYIGSTMFMLGERKQL